MPRINKAHRANFETLKKAGGVGNLALLDAYDKELKKSVVLVTAMGWDGKEYQMTPLAVMIDCNPYERYAPPAQNGKGYEGVGKNAAQNKAG